MKINVHLIPALCITHTRLSVFKIILQTTLDKFVRNAFGGGGRIFFLLSFVMGSGIHWLFVAGVGIFRFRLILLARTIFLIVFLIKQRKHFRKMRKLVHKFQNFFGIFQTPENRLHALRKIRVLRKII